MSVNSLKFVKLHVYIILSITFVVQCPSEVQSHMWVNQLVPGEHEGPSYDQDHDLAGGSCLNLRGYCKESAHKLRLKVFYSGNI